MSWCSCRTCDLSLIHHSWRLSSNCFMHYKCTSSQTQSLIQPRLKSLKTRQYQGGWYHLINYVTNYFKLTNFFTCKYQLLNDIWQLENPWNTLNVKWGIRVYTWTMSRICKLILSLKILKTYFFRFVSYITKCTSITNSITDSTSLWVRFKPNSTKVVVSSHQLHTKSFHQQNSRISISSLMISGNQKQVLINNKCQMMYESLYLNCESTL